MADTFLQAEWRKLAMANFCVDQAILQKYLPPNTEIELWNNCCYLSLVGFLFTNTRLKGFRIPFHHSFEEVNLRFYVKYKDKGTWNRGVVFIKEIVPRPALTFVARTVYHENYETRPMRHYFTRDNGKLHVEYKWKKKQWNSFGVVADDSPSPIPEGSEEEFIFEHYWGYTKINDRKTSAYRVEHPRWDVYPVNNHHINVDYPAIYGRDFSFLKTALPQSVFLAEGSAIVVKAGKLIGVP